MTNRNKMIVPTVLGVMAGLSLALVLGAGETKPEPAAAPPTAAMFENYVKSVQPNEKHKYLEQFVGEWETTMRMFMGPGAPPIESKGSASCKMVHGGRFLHQESKGSVKFPSPDGSMKDVPHTGLGLTGYDNNRKLYTFTWSDNMSTGLLAGKGNLSQDGKVLTMFGDMDEPLTGEIGKPVKYVTKILGPDKHVFEIFEVLYGEPFKVVEVEYTRKK